jgi:cell division protein ZipA
MEADTLRLILIVLGAFFVLGVYLWERREQIKQRLDSFGGSPKVEKQEPTLGSLASDPDQSLSGKEPDAVGAEPELEQLEALVARERGPETSAGEAAVESGPVIGRSRQAEGPATEQPTGPTPGRDEAGLPELILQVNVVASRGHQFAGADVLEAAAEAGLEPGEMQIYHRRHQGGASEPVLFSMASMVKPGTFPFDTMETFATPGLALFAKLPGQVEGLVVFNEMLTAAERLAERLDGDLQDETHSVLTRQTMEHLRSRVLEHGRLVQLARKKG